MYPMNASMVQEVTVKARSMNCDINNVMHFASVGGVWNQPGTISSQTFLTNFNNAWQAGVGALQSSTVSYLAITIKEIVGWHPTLGVPVVPAPTYGAQDEKDLVGTSGQLAGDVLPTFVGVTGRKKTAAPGRRFTGSIRFGGLVESQTEGGLGNFLTAAALIAWSGAWAGIALLDFTSGGDPTDDMELGVFSLKQLSVSEPAGPIVNTRPYWRPISNAPVNGYVGSQLSRKFRQPS